MRRSSFRLTHRGVCIAVALATTGCAASDLSASGPSFGFADTGYAYTGTNTSPAPPAGDTTTTAPPEQEDDFRLLPPAQTDAYVFVANPDRNTVTRVNVATLAVDTVSVGANPEIVLTTGDYRQAVVFNRGSDSVTLIDATTLDKRTVDIRENFNDMVLSPDGAYAVLWHNQARVGPDDPIPDGIQSFNETSFVNLQTGEHFPMAVGFNPRAVWFTPDGSLAVVVADAYLATVDLTVSNPSPDLIELVPDVLSAPRAEEVIVAPDGSFAWVRQFGATELLVVDLVSGEVTTRPAGDNPTDLDLSADGTEAIAVARGSGELYRYAADDPFAPPQVVPLPPNSPYGSLLINPSGNTGILYTNSSLTEQYGVWDIDQGEVRVRDLVKPVDGMAISPTGESLLIFHTYQDGADTEPLFSKSWALTLVEMSSLRENPLLLPDEITAYANSTDGRFGFFVMRFQPYLEVLDYNNLLHTEYELRSQPVFLGVLPDLVPDDGDGPPAWVSQEHELGRISFYDPDDQSIETLTGFELNSEVE